MYFISAAEIYSINEEILGKQPIVINRHLLRSAAKRPFQHLFGQEAYPTMIEKAAALLHTLAHDHLFIDGNKRTAQQAVTRFLKENGIEIHWTAQAAYDLILEIAKGQLDIPEIAQWLSKYTS
ncbi:MAG: type II toxin-antitoxin system death-on-curing family toxin [Phototrophicales bacterium]|nr:MAG: type II toxin-antitoxin system death-on-curing family toxin [Phototrophicales bacterium]RMG71123.1 MAG: type II toxin-antitoxin system death-on-curing family toxin [Chloroflexota bacterium]